MGFLRRLFGGQPAVTTTAVTTTAPASTQRQPAVLEQPARMVAVTFTAQRDDAWMDIVGEHAYASAFDEIIAEPGPDGLPTVNREALVVAEPTNPWDANAIAVHVLRSSGRADLVGYLTRENAVAYGPVLRAAAPAVIKAEAQVRGAWAGPGRSMMPPSVRLHLGSPGELAAEIWLEDNQPAPGHRWVSKTVAFTGGSGYSILGVRLDRLGMEFIARRAGCEVWPRVTKAVDVCVATHPDHETGNLKKAAEYGIEIESEADFWTELGLHPEVAR